MTISNIKKEGTLIRVDVEIDGDENNLISYTGEFVPRIGERIIDIKNGFDVVVSSVQHVLHSSVAVNTSLSFVHCEAQTYVE